MSATTAGLIVLGAAGAIPLAAISAFLFLHRPWGEPILRLLLRHYQPASYPFWAMLPAALALFWIALIVAAVFQKPEEDRRLDEHLRSRIDRPDANFPTPRA